MRDLAGYTALYGGSFDPPHMGHQMACLYLLQARRMADVWLVPTGAHAFEKRLSPYVHRRAMCERMAEVFGGRVRVDDIEHERRGTSYTIDTVDALQRAHPSRKFALVVGGDVVAELPRWHRVAELVARVPLIVLGRSGWVPPASVALGSTVWFIEPPSINLPDLTSRSVRQALGQCDDPAPIAHKLPYGVADYLREHPLYPAA